MEKKEKSPSKSYAIIKLPVKVENLEKASNLLGNKKEIYSKIKNGQDIDFNFFYNKLTLENCFSNDLLIQRKTYRNKKDKNKKKYKYKILGKVTNNMQSFSLENFIYINEEKTCLDDLQNYIISKETYEEEIKDKNKDNKELGFNEENQILSNLIKKKHKEINNNNEKEEKLEDFFSFIQPVNFANFKNSSQNVPKLIKDKIDIDKLNEFD